MLRSADIIAAGLYRSESIPLSGYPLRSLTLFLICYIMVISKAFKEILHEK